MDKNNFSEIYKKYVMTAYSAAMQVVHNEADADDIAQETMVKLYLNIDALDEDRVEGWVRVAAKNLGIDYQRKAQRFDWNELDEDLRAGGRDGTSDACRGRKAGEKSFFSGSDGCTERS